MDPDKHFIFRLYLTFNERDMDNIIYIIGIGDSGKVAAEAGWKLNSSKPFNK